jgi:hypothetical protein
MFYVIYLQEIRTHSVQKLRETNIRIQTALQKVRNNFSLLSVVTMLFDGQEGVNLHSEARELMCNIHECMIICMHIHLMKQFAFSGNQRPTML